MRVIYIDMKSKDKEVSKNREVSHIYKYMMKSGK